jgi:AP2-like factor (euAP2 lineage)
MREIPLTQGKRAMVDDDVYHLLKDVPFHAMIARGHYYARSHRSLLTGKLHTYLHWLVIAPPIDKRLQIHFIDGNTLNCQRYNLEYIEHSQNTQRHSKHQDNRKKHSKYLGVTKISGPRIKGIKWTVRFKSNGKLYYLGRFETEELAALAYNKKAIELYGQDCKLNIISDETENKGIV